MRGSEPHPPEPASIPHSKKTVIRHRAIDRTHLLNNAVSSSLFVMCEYARRVALALFGNKRSGGPGIAS
jgi:hypothetical protein